MNNIKSPKIYAAIKNRIIFLEIFLNVALLSLFAFSPITEFVTLRIQFRITNEYLQFLIFMIIFSGTFTLLGTVISYYSSYVIEHDFGLSNQTYDEWQHEQIKNILISAAIFLPLSVLFYFFLRVTGKDWWMYFGSAVFFFSILVARLAPVIIMPLFYKFIPVENDEIVARLTSHLRKYNIKSSNIYSFNLSKTTKKANAGFTGFGKTKRIILSDTLVENFTPDEIEVIFAHELGHYSKNHIFKNIIISGIIIFAAFYTCGLIYGVTIERLGYIEYYELSVIPVLFFYLILFSFAVTPLMNAISRHFEREADRFAVNVTGKPGAFIDAMTRLSCINLTDTEPARIIEFLFHSHPSVSSRIKSVKSINGTAKNTHFEK